MAQFLVLPLRGFLFTQMEQVNYKARYKAYLVSDHWKHLRADALNASGHVCAACGSAFMVDVHHLNYRNLTDCSVEDVISLCRECHYAVHKSESLKAQSLGLGSSAKRELTLRHLSRFRGPTYRQVAEFQRKKAERLAEEKKAREARTRLRGWVPGKKRREHSPEEVQEAKRIMVAMILHSVTIKRIRRKGYHHAR